MKTNITKTLVFIVLAFLPVLTRAQNAKVNGHNVPLVSNVNYAVQSENTFSLLISELKSFLPASTKTTESHGSKRIEMKIDRISESIARSVKYRPMDIQIADKLTDSDKELEAFTIYMEQTMKYKPSVSL